MMISITILTKNSRQYLETVLNSVQDFAEVIIYDNGSTDDTLEIAKKFKNVKIIIGKFEGFGPTHNIASSHAKHEWVLSLDSDEIVTDEMSLEIKSLQLDENSVYSFSRHNYFNNKFIKWCGWYPDRQIRLYNRTKTQFDDAKVHEAIMLQGMKVIALKAAMIHYSYASISDFLNKMQSYSNLFAEQNRHIKKSSPCKAALHGSFAFFKSYILKRGFLGGYEGFIISAYNGHTSFYKYMKLYEANLKEISNQKS